MRRLVQPLALCLCLLVGAAHIHILLHRQGLRPQLVDPGMDVDQVSPALGSVGDGGQGRAWVCEVPAAG